MADSIEIFRSFRVSMTATTRKVLPAALRKYNIDGGPYPCSMYGLFIVYGEEEREMHMDERPLVIFKRLDREGRRPMFMVRRTAMGPDERVDRRMFVVNGSEGIDLWTWKMESPLLGLRAAPPASTETARWVTSTPNYTSGRPHKPPAAPLTSHPPYSSPNFLAAPALCPAGPQFTCFLHLPLELQRLIYFFALPAPRTLHVNRCATPHATCKKKWHFSSDCRPPVMLQVCSEAREEVLRWYELQGNLGIYVSKDSKWDGILKTREKGSCGLTTKMRYNTTRNMTNTPSGMI